ncbi:hypothetical protein BDM02DRAFT_1315081 [Thelephora ganbajun]|uniref:Uncharacterized protein n=1 Tax=Thelephora ganbajun TaxID=370292 RepID=A0ACB6Z2K7_THEGA|nr:hypothetical protein BDM02DRAFT_1315081 [Thelephora ganbajun]
MSFFSPCYTSISVMMLVSALGPLLPVLPPFLSLSLVLDEVGTPFRDVMKVFLVVRSCYSDSLFPLYPWFVGFNQMFSS